VVFAILLALALGQTLQSILAAQFSLGGVVSPPIWHFAIAGGASLCVSLAASALAARTIGGLNILDLLRSD